MEPIRAEKPLSVPRPPQKRPPKATEVASRALKIKKNTKPLPNGQMVFREVNGKWTMVKGKHRQICTVPPWPKEYEHLNPAHVPPVKNSEAKT